ncbi:phage head completion protein [Flavobacterium johnsoniae]|nr:head-tail adaptor protein [Flavobacterium johnsoniae]
MRKNPYIGQMDRMIQIVQKQTNQSTSGAETVTEITISNPWASMEDVSGTEETDGKIKHLVNRTYTIRFDENVKSKSNNLILIDDSKKYEVLHVIEIGRRQHLELRVKNYE